MRVNVFFKSASGNDFKEIQILNSNHENVLEEWTSFLEYKPGKILFAGYNSGACGIFNLKTNDAQLSNTKFLDYPKGIYIQNLFKDKSGKLWFITSAGIETLEPFPFVYENFIISNGDLCSIGEDKEGIIWAGSHNKLLASINIENKKIDFYKLKNGDEGFYVSISPLSGNVYGLHGLDPYEFDKASKSFKKLMKFAGCPEYGLWF